MTRDEFEQILQLLGQIESVAYERYEDKYLPRILADGGHMHSLPEPEPFIGRPMIAGSPEATIDRAIQETNIAYVYQLNHAVTKRATLPQNMHDNYCLKDRIIDGINYMGVLTNDMIRSPKYQIPNIAYRVKVDKIIELLTAILQALQTL